MKIIDAIPEADRPIFLFLKYHLRRPSEACVLKWGDFDEINQTFIVRRSLSARTIVESTKTKAIHVIPCHGDFLPVLKKLRGVHPGPYIFVNVRSRFESKRYAIESLNVIWKKACADAGETIDLYSGLKHSSYSQFINEKGLTMGQLQIITDHANIESTKKYAKVEMDLKRQLMETSPKHPPSRKKITKIYE
ncbi:MAG: tyrosine-type recombinase/integrase [Desulfosalsimonadaceae bacterium]